MHKRLVMAVLAISLGGCGSGVQIVRVPLISPVVVPVAAEPHPFMMNVSVKNYGKTDSSDLWLKIYSEYYSSADFPRENPPCTQTEWLHVGPLAPDKAWAQTDYRIDRSSSCACLKDKCPGHVWLDLHVANGYAPPISGTDTALHVNWVASGDLSQETVKNF